MSFKLLMICILFIFNEILICKIWYVNNNSGLQADFTDIPLAILVANTGDTLYIGGSSISYTGITLQKKLCIIGPGYFLDENPGSPYSTLSATISTRIYCKPGSEGSIFTGLILRKGIAIQTDSILIEKNRFLVGGAQCITFEDVTNCIISKNYILCTDVYTTNMLEFTGNSQNIVISNNLIYDNTSNIKGIYMNSTSTATIRNNIVVGVTNSFYNATIENNIFDCVISNVNNCNVRNNLCRSNALGSLNGNIPNVIMSTVFTGTGSSDNKWQLQIGSQGHGSGHNGVDCGIFGGPDPYILSGLPSIPIIYDLSVPTFGTTSGGLNVTIKARSIK